MNTGEFKSSINQMESELTSSKKKLHEKFEKLKSDFKELTRTLIDIDTVQTDGEYQLQLREQYEKAICVAFTSG